MIAGHGGNINEAAAWAGISPDRVTDMSSNTNPLGPMPGMMAHLKNALDAVTRLPEPDARSVARAFAEMSGLDPERVLAAGGTTQLIYALPRIFPSGRALVVGPTYADYADACAACGLAVHLALPEDGRTLAHDPDRLAGMARAHDLVFLCNPNNPTGHLTDREAILRLARKCPATVFVVDESYLPFVRGASSLTLAGTSLPNVATLASFSKIYKVPGLRIGFAAASKSILEKLHVFQQPWSVGSLAQEAVFYAAQNRAEALGHIQAAAGFVARERKRMEALILGVSGLVMIPGVGPFVLFRLPEGVSSRAVWEAMLGHGLLVRDCANFQGLGGRYARISLKDEHANTLAAQCLVSLAGGPFSKAGPA